MPRLRVNDWLLAEAFRHVEERVGRQPDAAALAIARDRGGDLPGRIRARANALEQAPGLRADIQRLRRALAWLGGALLLVGLALGALAARATIADRQVDILLATAALLLVPSLMLIAWVAAMLLGLRRGGSGGLVGGVVLNALRWLGPRLLSSPHSAEAMTAFGGAAATPWGRWRLSAITHGFWLAYAAGASATLFVFFAVVQYELTWGTTLLSDDSVVGLVEWLAAWPELLGLMPEADRAWIEAGREGTGDVSARAQWARFLLAMIAAWAMVPRAILGLASLGVSALVGRRMELDTTRPGYLRLAADLSPARAGAETKDRPVPEAASRPRRRRRSNAEGILAVAVELEGMDVDVAGLVPGIELIDLGRADDRAGRSAAIETVEGLRRPAAAVIGVCSMLRTPDAGTERFLARLAEGADAPLWIVVDEGGRFEARGGDVASRRQDWQALADRAGGQAVFIDREAPGAAELARLHRALDGGGVS
ncbi:DUF2868 domain-containing protein [Wenzhouxiangella sediminis]|uniref:DUF2868 domain-containing protein n=1 Tax=Wenzhouxiangella sediminis TaxID=1792836 RepID=A0A3E1K840_9GAMM|nr:DUF2868 domain-containing protein [Wenzhouxiangella sediminis]RFF30234.1 DUF2868 domain-containing protein [Wenzhouxiangella sediminis]